MFSVWVGSGETDCGNFWDVQICFTSAELPGFQMLAASLFAVFNLRLSIFTPRGCPFFSHSKMWNLAGLCI